MCLCAVKQSINQSTCKNYLFPILCHVQNDVEEEEPGKDHQEMPEDMDSDMDGDVDKESQGSSANDSDNESGWETVDEEDDAAESSSVSGQQEAADWCCNNAPLQKKANVTTPIVKSLKRKTSKCAEGDCRVQIKNSPDVLNGPQLIEFLESLSVNKYDDEELTTIGMVCVIIHALINCNWSVLL